MWMTDSQIFVLYRDARFRDKQIKILAQLNDCPTEVIRTILRRNGADLPARAQHYGHDLVNADQLREARRLRRTGATYAEIASATGIPARSVRYFLGKFRKEDA